MLNPNCTHPLVDSNGICTVCSVYVHNVISHTEAPPAKKILTLDEMKRGTEIAIALQTETMSDTKHYELMLEWAEMQGMTGLVTELKSLDMTDEKPAHVSAEISQIPTALYDQLDYLGILPSEERGHNVGESDYSKQLIQPWSIWLSYPNLTSFDHDIIKRILRDKSTDPRKLDYEKIIHICKERIRQIELKERINAR